MLPESLLSRRRLLQGLTLGAPFVSRSGWLGALAAASSRTSSAPAPARKKSVILLWLNGGPSTIDLWDLKPGHENGGPFKEIRTSVPGFKICENLPRLGAWAKHLTMVRSLTSKEGDHARATAYLRTGYTPQGGILFPALGSLVAQKAAPFDDKLPHFVSVAPARYPGLASGGFLGPKFAPLVVGEGATGPEGLTIPELASSGAASAADPRLTVLDQLDRGFLADRDGTVPQGIQASTQRALSLLRPDAAAAFQLEREPGQVRDLYGRGLFGQGCLLARRLVERGVTFVEVSLDGWDTHQDNFGRVKGLSTTLDQAFAQLLSDLKDRGLLESTLVVCQGEFGRTPKINENRGRDHWPRSWAVALAGGSIRGGQAIGATDKSGMEVVDKPVRVPDLIATVCQFMGIDPMAQNASNVGRPIRVADPSAKVIEGVL